MAILNALSTVSTAALSLSNLVLASPNSTVGYQPNNPSGGSQSSFFANLLNLAPKSLLFHYEGENTVSLESDITDHYIQDNTALQDQIALRPEVITVHGFIGELNNVPPPILASLQQSANTLQAINAYSPGLSISAFETYNAAFQAYQTAQSVINSASSAWSSITGTGGESVIGDNGLNKSPNQNLQQTMFQQLWGYWNNRTLFTVQTPWAVFQNMAILKIRAIQGEETKVITDFELTFKRIRTASSLLGLGKVTSSILSNLSASVTSIGTQTPASGTSASSAFNSTF